MIVQLTFQPTFLATWALLRTEHSRLLVGWDAFAASQHGPQYSSIVEVEWTTTSGNRLVAERLEDGTITVLLVGRRHGLQPACGNGVGSLLSVLLSSALLVKEEVVQSREMSRPWRDILPRDVDRTPVPFRGRQYV